VEYGAVCNGSQLVVFIAVRRDKPPLQGRAIVIESLGDLKKHFAILWQNLSPEALRQRRLTRTLTLDAEAAVPPKLSASVFSYHQHRATGGNIRKLIELFTMFIGSPNVDFDSMIEIERKRGSYSSILCLCPLAACQLRLRDRLDRFSSTNIPDTLRSTP
jgi:hypothetical protein